MELHMYSDQWRPADGEPDQRGSAGVGGAVTLCLPPPSRTRLSREAGRNSDRGRVVPTHLPVGQSIRGNDPRGHPMQAAKDHQLRRLG